MRVTHSSVVASSPYAVFAHCTSISGFRQLFPFKVRWLEGPTNWADGNFVHFQYRVWGLWYDHAAHIVEFERDRLFTDELTDRGLFRYFRHCHRFEPVGPGTQILDDVEFSTRYGDFVDRYVAASLVRRSFVRRHRALGQLFGADVPL